MYAYKTLIDLIVSRQDEKSRGITFILGEADEQFVSYSELYHGSLFLLHSLQSAGFEKNDEVIFQIDNNRDFMFAFWACIMGGMIPVPVTTGTNDEHKLKLFKIWNILKNPKMLATGDFFTRLKVFGDKNGLAEQVAIMENCTLSMENLKHTGTAGKITEAGENDIAFIQFSSGSTGDPKGVIITHKNVLADIGAVIRWVNINSEDAGLNWMPLTHDMGLIGTHIKDVIACINQYNIETQLFIRHPSLWIEKASEHRVTLLYSPNFGYKHFLTFFKPDVKKDWDLSSVRLIYNGAEPISSELCDEFLGKLSPYGLKRSAMYTVYGLAEGTIAVTFPRFGDELKFVTLDRRFLNVGDTVREVNREDSCGCTFADEGYPIYDCHVRICDAENNGIGENRIGYVCISGANVTCGYYNNEEATRRAITGEGWLNTGDLGFMRDGRLVITGRAKDVIFVKGQNYYSHDIERVAQELEGIDLGKIVAVGAFNEKIKSDELILFVLFKMKPDKFTGIVRNLKKLISEKMGIEVSEVIPIKSIPKTTSGKVQRYKLRDGYINGEYDDLKNEIRLLMESEADSRQIEMPENEYQEKMVKIWQKTLGIGKISVKDNFFDLGGDSLKVTQLISRIRQEFGTEIDHTDLFANPDLNKLTELVQKSERQHIEYEQISHIEEGGVLPLSFAQQRIWFLDRLNTEDSSQYMLYSGLHIKGSLNYEVLVKSINKILERHESLRTSFSEENGQPVQRVQKGLYIELPLVSLMDMPAEDRKREAIILAKKEAGSPFSLATAPLIRGKLFQINDDEYILVLAAHHMVFDGWSFKVLLEELTNIYNSYMENKEYILPELKITYSDFARWQMKRCKEKSIQKQLEYWKQKLSGSLPVLELPVSKQRPPVQTYNGANFRCTLSSKLADRLKSAAEQEGATLYMILLAAFKVLLFKYTGQEDIIIGSPVAGRTRSELEPMIGFFTNNLVIRTAFSGSNSFRELLRLVRNVTLEAYSNQEVPFEKIVEELKLERDMSRNPLFQIFFSLQDSPVPETRLSGASIENINIDGDTSRFDLSVDISHTTSGLEVNFEYNTDLFDYGTIERMAGHYSQLLENVTADFESQIKNIDILSKEERKTLLKDWNQTYVDFGSDLRWIRLFEEQASRNPGAVAVVKGAEQLSYGELDRRANQLANYLTALGVGPETIVGIYIDRSIDMLIAIVGVHKAGGAYLPMDPVFPKDRLEYMLDNAQVPVILTDNKFKDTLPENNAKVICIGEARSEIAAYGFEKPKDRSKQDNLAYVIYTSGSTGKPKGVQIEQGALTNFLLSMSSSTNITEKDRLLAVTTLSFDIAGLEMMLPLTAGARVVIADREEVIDGEKLIGLINKYDISIMQATPATWRLLVEAGWKGSSRLKILCGGEALSRELANELLDRCCCLWNVYGPTETTIWSTMAALDSKEGPVHIGKPIANTRVYILDSEMKPTPVGIPGELYIGGAGLARGYLKLSQLTDEKFVNDPFSNIEGSKLYKTGDIVRFMPDGNMEFAGRSDHQVKIRGFRIELGEIETILDKNPLIKQSVVISREVLNGEKALVAYIIPKSEETPVMDNFREYLKEKLPDYMIPSYFVMLDSFPMTPNGKIDRKSLPMPEKVGFGLAPQKELPSNDIQKTVADIWKEVLGRENIGLNENFFDLGGHSLLMAKVRSKISKAINIEIQIMDLFRYPTVSTLADYLEQRSGKKTSAVQSKTSPFATTIESNDIAVIGISARVPGARNIKEFWRNLCDGRETISHFSDKEIIAEGIDPEILRKPGYVKAWGVLEDADKFDAQFFGYNPREAEILDPQQRIFLEEAWKALEDAGCDSERFDGAIGTFASVGMNTYINNLSEDSGTVANNYQIMINNDKDFLATRVAYKLNLEGPGITVQTACSSSMVAVHLACKSLLYKECDIALAGGVSIRLPQKTGYLYQEGMILSPDGHCRAFDESAKGTVGGNGAGVVVLKRLEDAIAEGDNIYAVIKGTAVNNDGSLKAGYTAPRIDGEAGVIAKAQNVAGVNPETITYIETHGTGTPLGDPIEIEALNKVFSEKTDKKQYCAIGSVKTNIGHLDAASGVMGLIKTVLCLKNGKLPSSLNFEKPNPKCDFENGPFYVNKKLCVWKTDDMPRRAGVSSFGIGGTNAHAVLEEAPAKRKTTHGNSRKLLIFSAKTVSALNRIASNFALYLRENPDIDIADAAYTLKLGRRELEQRCFLVCTTREEAIEALESNRLIYGNGLNNKHEFVEDKLEEYSEEELGSFWLQGIKIDWNKLYEGQVRNKLSLPAYPFEGQVFWAKSKRERNSQKDISEYFYAPIWKQSVYNITSEFDFPENGNKSCLVLMNENSFENSYVELLTQSGAEAFRASAGYKYTKNGFYDFEFNPERQEDYDALLTELADMGKMPGRIINMLGVTRDGVGLTENGINKGKGLFYSMLFLAKALGKQDVTEEIHIDVLTNNMQKVFGETVLYPEKSLVLGPCKVIPREYSNIKCRSVDFILCEEKSNFEQELLEQLLYETLTDPSDAIVAYRGQSRWIQSFERMKPQNVQKSALQIKNKGTYLITGGLGGIGLVLAECLAEKERINLVLLGRSSFPDMEKWDKWLADNQSEDITSVKIQKLKRIKELGTEILICRADINNADEMAKVHGQIREHFGKIDGVIHAAGNPGGGMIQMKERNFAENVIAPKFTGTQVLYELLKEEKPDFFIMSSSLNAITGGFGQADYSAANNFLDAFVNAYDTRHGTRFVSIDWDRWPGVGMAKGIKASNSIKTTPVHPLLGRRVSDSPDKTVFLTRMSPKKDWVLNEHLVLGIPTIAGTTYIEMARAAFSDINSKMPVELSEVTFLTPMAVRENEEQDVMTVLIRNGEHYDFKVVSRLYSEGEENPWHEHARGKITHTENPEMKQADLSDILNRCNEEIFKGDNDIKEEFISFGNRWRTLKRLSLHEDEAIAEIELSPEFINDLQYFNIHPALLDVATGSVRLASKRNFLPVSYEKIIVKQRLPEKIFAHIRFKNDYKAFNEIITSDVEILDEKGAQLVEIINFSMRYISDSSAENIRSRIPNTHSVADNNNIYNSYINSSPNTAEILDVGLTTAEGRKVFEKILSEYFNTQVIVSTRDIVQAIADAGYTAKSGTAGAAEKDRPKTLHPRPELSSAYSAPKSEIEKKLTPIWQNLLGIDGLGIHDEFFELGGDSLLLVQLHAEIKEMFHSDLAVVDLYKYNTIALLAQKLGGENAQEEKPSFKSVSDRVNKQQERLKQRKQKMFLQRGENH
ncbi:MAG TPA: amino acid adenylation domain-containing protein [Ruminiclostridium sp.]|nr:amino acid adenylation domain-containing protein [Ruminiclostridium sp.]